MNTKITKIVEVDFNIKTDEEEVFNVSHTIGENEVHIRNQHGNYVIMPYKDLLSVLLQIEESNK